VDVFHWGEDADTDIYPSFCSYNNHLGQGDRRTEISWTTDASWTGFAFSDILNGNLTSNAFQFVAGQSGRHVPIPRCAHH
jgi:hypothetical protein